MRVRLDLRPRVGELDAACVRLRRNAFRSAAVRGLPACAHRAACPVLPWELRRRGAGCLLVLYCRGHPVHHRFRDVAGIAKAVHRDAARAHHRDGPAARCSDDIVAELHQPGACLAAQLDVIVPAQNQALPDVPDSVAKLKVLQQDAEHRAPLPQDVLLQGRFLVLLQVGAARRVAAQMSQAQLQDVQRKLKQETRVRLPQASQPQVPRQLHALQDELPSCPQVRQIARHPEPSQGQLRERAPQHRASRQPPQEHRAPRHQHQASRPRLQVLQERPQQASPPASSQP